MPTDCSAGPECSRGAEQQRGQHAFQGIPAREDDERDSHQALARRQPLVPGTGVVEGEEGAGDAGQETAGGRRQETHEVDGDAHGASGGRAVARRPQDQAPSGVAEAPGQEQGHRQTDQKQRVDIERLAQGRRHAQPLANRHRRQPRSGRLDVGLAEEEGEADAERHHGDADGDVVDARQLADEAVHGAESHADDAGAQHAYPRRAGAVGGHVGDHGAQDQRPLETQIDAPRFLGDGLTQRHEHERRRDTDGAAEHGNEHGGERGLVHTRSALRSPLKILKRP